PSAYGKIPRNRAACAVSRVLVRRLSSDGVAGGATETNRGQGDVEKLKTQTFHFKQICVRFGFETKFRHRRFVSDGSTDQWAPLVKRVGLFYCALGSRRARRRKSKLAAPIIDPKIRAMNGYE